MMDADNHLREICKIFEALSHPIRLAILAKLVEGDLVVSAIGEDFKITGPSLTHHLSVLQKAGLIVRIKEAHWRLCQLRGDSLREIACWLKPYQRFWDEDFPELADYLRTHHKRHTA